MSTTARLHHPSLPAPVVHAGFSIPQSKSHVLAGVQDAYWSDEEGEDADCPLCLEEMDISDTNFKPCVCGYQICRFCWHHIKENLNGRCPACRRIYTDEAVQFKPINKEDHKRLTQQKKQREKERKDLDSLGRRHLANVRVVQRNVVYVVGIGPRFAKEELIPTLRSNEYFGQYGKISKILLVKRTPSGGGAPVVGLYITYHRREDAARAIAAVDGSPSPSGGREVMRASYGTTKYCMAFLRGASCSEHGCMNLHEWGDEKDCFTKEDLTTLKHTMKTTESRSRNLAGGKKGEESDGSLPRTAAWGSKPTVIGSSSANTNTNASASSSCTRRTGRQRTKRTTTSDSRSPRADLKISSAGLPPKPLFQMSSRPSTPAPSSLPPRPATPPDIKTPRQRQPKKESAVISPPSSSPAPSAEEEDTDLGSESVNAIVSGSESSSKPVSAQDSRAVPPSATAHIPVVPPGLASSSAPPVAPPGLSAPPGLTHPSIRTNTNAGVRTETPPTPLLASQSSYQMSTAARALVDDVKARREVVNVAEANHAVVSPFPDFDRTLAILSGGSGSGGFMFELDKKIVGENEGDERGEEVDGYEFGVNGVGYPVRYLQGGLGSSVSSPPGLGFSFGGTGSVAAANASGRSLYDQTGRTASPVVTLHSSYTGSFNPFGESAEGGSMENSRSSPGGEPGSGVAEADEERKVSRFGFARRPAGLSGSVSLPSLGLGSTGEVGRTSVSPLSNAGSHQSHSSFFGNLGDLPPPQAPWSTRVVEYGFPGSVGSSPMLQHAQVAGLGGVGAYSQLQHPQQLQPQQSRFQPFDSTPIGGAQLTQSGGGSTGAQPQFGRVAFHDPAIMAASGQFSLSGIGHPGLSNANTSTHSNPAYSSVGYGPPPGLYTQGGGSNVGTGGMARTAASMGMNDGLEQHPQQVNNGGGNNNVNVNASTTSSPSLSVALSAVDFPALGSAAVAAGGETGSNTRDGSLSPDERKAQLETLEKLEKVKTKVEKKAAKKAVAQERAAERLKLAQEKALLKAEEKAKIAEEKARQREKEKVEKEKAEMEVAAAKAKAVLEIMAKEREGEKIEAAIVKKEQEKGKASGKGLQAKKVVAANTSGGNKQVEAKGRSVAANSVTKPTPVSESPAQVPLLSKKPKKSKPIVKPIRVPKEAPLEGSAVSTATSEVPPVPFFTEQPLESSSNVSRVPSVDLDSANEPTSVDELLEEIDAANPIMDLPNHPFFDMSKINPAAKMPLEYGPLVHALSALSVGGGSFANNIPSGSIDTAVSSFQQLLETLTQTISDLLRLLPRTTWDDSSSFDGVLRDMLKGDDFLDDGGDDGTGREDEVVALTLALERRARWMEVQLSKLEELHRDINTAAVRAVLSFNDCGWDQHSFMPRMGNTLRRFDNIAMVDAGDGLRQMTANELDEKLVVAKEAVVFAETELREAMEKVQAIRVLDVD